MLVNEAGPKRKRKESRWREGARGEEEEEDATKACAGEREGEEKEEEELKGNGATKVNGAKSATWTSCGGA